MDPIGLDALGCFLGRRRNQVADLEERLSTGSSLFTGRRVLRFSRCGGSELRIIVAILDRAVTEKILCHLGLDLQPPPKGQARVAGQGFTA